MVTADATAREHLMTAEDDLAALFREQGLLILSLRGRIAELETKCDDVIAKNLRLEARVMELASANHVLRGQLERYDATDEEAPP
jgi:hypothetical protein